MVWIEAESLPSLEAGFFVGFGICPKLCAF